MTNIASVLSESAAKHPKNIAVKFMGQDTTYAQLEASVNKVAHALQEKGIGKGDDDGYFYILDREKDLIIINGMNIYPRMIKEVLANHSAVRECAVIGVPHKRSGEMVKAYVVLKETNAATTQDLRRYCLKNLAQFQTPRRIEIIEKLPCTATGKILKRELRKWGEHERGFEAQED
ncbi:AMP-binding protein [bacterium]|nr:AMP-binding protein [bacterium]